MTNDTTNDTTDCPSAEDLCAWFDGQLSSAAIDAHVDSCAQCKSIVKSYQRIDRQIKENVERPTQRDMGILVRIKDGSMNEINRSSSWMTPMIMVKILLSCGIIIALLGTIYFLPKKGSNGKDTPDRQGKYVPPTVQSISEDDKVLITLARENMATFETVEMVALGTNPEILDPFIEKTPEKELRPDLICVWSTQEPSMPLRFFKNLFSSKYHKVFDEKILASSDYCTVILTFSDDTQRTRLNDLLKGIGCTHESDSSVTKLPATGQKIRFSFIHKK
jgi:hypothetical protein